MNTKNEHFLIVKPAFKEDAGKLVARIHEVDKPDDIEWGDWVSISERQEKEIKCRKKVGCLIPPRVGYDGLTTTGYEDSIRVTAMKFGGSLEQGLKFIREQVKW